MTRNPRRRTAWAAGGLAALLLAGTILAAALAPWQSPASNRGQEATPAMYSEGILRVLAAAGHDVARDSDGDGLVDVLENFQYGSDPFSASTTGNGIPDGWFARYGYDPSEPGVEGRIAALPPVDKLPPAYGGAWPTRYHWTLRDAYEAGRPSDWPQGEAWDSGVDPRHWENGAGVASAWLAFYGLSPQDAAEDRLLDGDLTVRRSYETDTNPHIEDTDQDGLTDRDEVDIHRTNPRKASTSGAGPADGWLIRHGLDPFDGTLGSRDLAGKGLTVNATWTYNVARFDRMGALEGKGLHPLRSSSRDDGIPDGWLVRHGLDPLDSTIASARLQCASDHELAYGFEPMPNGAPAIPDLCLDVAGAYRHAIPAEWREATMGPWGGGLHPARQDYDGDGLPDTVELRGWYVRRVLSVGPGDNGTFFLTRADPRQPDTDRDGLTDREEHDGRAHVDGRVVAFDPSDPTNADTAFSGLTDFEKVKGVFAGERLALHREGPGGLLVPWLDPSRADSAGSYLTDGQSLRHWIKASKQVQEGIDYRAIYPGSRHEGFEAWLSLQPGANGQALTRQQAADLMAPFGDVDGDGAPNIGDATPAGDGLFAGWKVDPLLLRFSDFPSQIARSPLDPANPDTDGDRLPDAWELRYGRASALGGSDVDPARADSDGDGLDDAAENLDDDAVNWAVRQPGNLALEGRSFEFTNGHELQAGTDPRVADEDGDGLADGWSFFWRRLYPGLVQSGDAGDRTPTQAEIAAVESRLVTPGERPGFLAKGEVNYLRFASPPPSAADLDASRDEEIQGVTAIGPKLIATITGTYRHTFAADSRHGLNPYLEDTDGDGMPDAWEAMHASRCPGGPSALMLDGGADPDRDGLTNLEEYGMAETFGHSTDPCLADTDADGVEDAAAAELGNPLLPGSTIPAGSNQDRDGDKVLDIDELGRSDPLRPDTAFSGLLDGPAQCLDPQSPAEAERAAIWLAQGIAHRSVAGSSCSPQRSPTATFLQFLGSSGIGRNPNDQDSFGDGIPDGWAAYHQVSPLSKKKDSLAKYQCAMPSWWKVHQEALGPWWWGVAPGAGSACSRDLDADGLDDANGEDPVPAASRSNAPSTTPGTLPAALEDAMPAIDLVRLAQGYGECAGNPLPCREAWNQEWPVRAQSRTPALLQATAPGAVVKEMPFQIAGTLVARCGNQPCMAGGNPVGLANRVVVARMDEASTVYAVDDGKIIGAALTGPTGSFTINACVCRAGGTLGGIPAGVTALGRLGSTATWATDASAPAAGSVIPVSLHAYATPTFLPTSHPQWIDVVVDGTPRHASEPATWQGPLASLSSATDIEVALPATVPWTNSRSLAASIQLRDASGGPLGQQQVRLSSEPPALLGASGMTRITDGQGNIALSLPIPPSLSGPVRILASFASATAFLGSSQGHATVLLQAPAVVDILAPPATVNIGETLTVEARATSNGQPVAGAPIRLALGTQAVDNVTEVDGRATFRLLVGGAPGTRTLTARILPSPERAGATDQAPMQVVAGSRLLATTPAQAEAGGPLPIKGRLESLDGSGLANAIVAVMLDDRSIGSILTDNLGQLERTLRLPANLQPGTHRLRLVYAGSHGLIGGDTAETDLAIRTATLLHVDPASASRGGQATVTGRLTGPTGAGLAGQPVHHLLLNPTQERVAVVWPLLAPWSLQAVTAHLLDDGSVGLLTLDGQIVIVTQEDGSQHPAFADLMDQLTNAKGRPVSATAALPISVDNVNGRVETVFAIAHLSTAITSSDGSFSAAHPVPSTGTLGPWPTLAIYVGSADGRRGGSRVEGSLAVGDPTRIAIEGPSVLARGNNEVFGRLLENSQETPVAGKQVLVNALGETATAVTDAEGRFRVPLRISADVEPGDIRLNASAAGDSRHGAATLSWTIPFRISPTLALHAPFQVAPGTTALFEVAILDDLGRPMHGSVQLTFLGTTHTLRSNAKPAPLLLLIDESAMHGVHRFVAAFGGNSWYESVSVERNVTVRAGALLQLEELPSRIRPDALVPVTMRLTAEGQTLAGQLVTVRLGAHGATLVATTDSQGVAVVYVKAPQSGVLELTANFPGTPDLASSATAVAIPVEPASGTAPAWLIPGVASAVALALIAAAAWWLRSRTRAKVTMHPLWVAERRIRIGDPWTGAVLLAQRQLADQVATLRGPGARTTRDVAQALVEEGLLNDANAVRLVQLVEAATFAGTRLRPEDALMARRVLSEVLRPGPDGGGAT